MNRGNCIFMLQILRDICLYFFNKLFNNLLKYFIITIYINIQFFTVLMVIFSTLFFIFFFIYNFFLLMVEIRKNFHTDKSHSMSN